MIHYHHVVTPIDAPDLSAIAASFPRRPGLFVLGDAPGAAPHLAHHSLLGGEPVASFRAWRTGKRSLDRRAEARVVVTTADGRSEDVGDAFDALRKFLRAHEPPREVWTACPLPFCGGAMGYVGYEAGQMLEVLPGAVRPKTALPDIAFFVHRWVLGRDAAGRGWLSVLGAGTTPAAAAEDASSTTGRIVRHVGPPRATSLPARSSGPAPSDAALFANTGARAWLDREAYADRVRTAKGHIARGDAFEICLTHRIDAPFVGDPLDLWNVLRRDNPAPFSAFLALEEGAIVSSSPERFLRLDAEGVVESRPIKGTRPRAEQADEDARIADELHRSVKDRAENAMIVDLVRNDLGKVCAFGTVSVPELFVVETFPTVHQLVSTIRGKLQEGRDAVALLSACFPPGSMTGAPKIEAMSILEELEPTERGVYAGGLGFVDFRGTLDMSVVIRTLVVADGTAHLAVGGAVVADSDPYGEHDEAMHKARALLSALACLREARA